MQLRQKAQVPASKGQVTSKDPTAGQTLLEDVTFSQGQ